MRPPKLPSKKNLLYAQVFANICIIVNFQLRSSINAGLNVMTSCVKSDHKALVVNDRSSASSTTVVSDSVRSPATVFKLTPVALDNLSNALQLYNWSGITLALDSCDSSDEFSKIYDVCALIRNRLCRVVPISISDEFRDVEVICCDVIAYDSRLRFFCVV